MPTYGPEQISDAELEEIIAWIQTLGPPMGAGPFAGSMMEAAHLRLALVSLQAGDLDDARAHLKDLDAMAEGETKDQAQEFLHLLEEGDLHEAEHGLEMILIEAEGNELTAVQLYIVLALNALQAHDDADAVRHLESAINVATGEEKARLEDLLTELKEGHAHDVGHELEEMLGLEPHGS
jgi:Tfp pilus assembly protein PilF